jgi:hypothetical protein
MNEKPKRDQNLPVLDFVTALTPPECVERLKESAFHVTNTRFFIRANDQQFMIEDATKLGSIFRLSGYFSADHGGTRIVGWLTFQREYNRYGTADAGLFSLTFGVAGGIGLLFALMQLAMGGFVLFFVSAGGSILTFVVAHYFYIEFRRMYQQTQDNLTQWIQQRLYKPLVE